MFSMLTFFLLASQIHPDLAVREDTYLGRQADSNYFQFYLSFFFKV